MIPINYVLRTLVYLQSFLWLYILFIENDLRGPITHEQVLKWFGIYFSFTAYTYVLVNDVSFSQYTSELIGVYILMVLLCIGVFSTKYIPKDAIALSFLIVFINSYYWESMHHFNAIILYGLSFNQLIQMFHLIPAYFLMKRLEFHNSKRVKKLLIYGLIISCTHLISLYVLFSFGWKSSFYYLTTPITRVLTLGILITIVMDEVKYIKKGF